MNFESKLSEVSKRIKSSIIRELLKVANNPGMISFGGGVPDPDTFPRNKLAEISKEILENEHRFVLQYGTTEGDVELKKGYINLLKKYDGIDWVKDENMVITVGSQQALYLVGMTLLDKNSYCGVSRPIYLGAASAFSQRAPKFINIPLTKDGLDLEYLERELEKLYEIGEIDKFKFVYAISNFHNPGGVTMNLEKRKKLVELAEKYDFLIVEDDPYGALRFEGNKVPSIYSLAPNRTILLNTFSKVLAPGLRLGVIIGDEFLIRKITMTKQAADLCSPSLTQRLAARYIQRYDLYDEIAPTIKLYGEKKDTMMKAIEENLGDIKDIDWTRPEGGLFTWITLPKGIDTMEMFEMAKMEKVLYIPGEAFYVDEPDRNTMRISFCLPSHEEIHEGMRRLRRVIDKYAKEKGIEI
ncbi:PLP-dependent aminotransferase family protein [Oceanotoga sp. DSM 15011]|jgi:DNA-binding transcriptional MocR family regulator|uniref:Aromatic amino acid aminotransferase n=1 Tax=Oceanotoga teriensis TaxID=515440 RepID=A0AA45HHQ1_9BACT|nr:MULTISPECIES: PLP-dependent aminotransferase family protein [Oceanotoga]MDN5342330.1 2-aminoadipate transaminase [Oceanotoga sp.]MDO7976131.1 PLP-dependent aminotransferase family protein [Oceanotoga teriensis]PWJ87266.1 aromatic amino acid aminotransferase [Oceanotoga teriensis]UYP00967.1 PLP-dependent aminotransferase family protein [Oceanotoga sp. DSM 15011]